MAALLAGGLAAILFYLQYLEVSVLVLSLLQQLLDVCKQLLAACVCFLLKLRGPSLFFLQTQLQTSNFIILNRQLGSLQHQTMSSSSSLFIVTQQKHINEDEKRE